MTRSEGQNREHQLCRERRVFVHQLSRLIKFDPRLSGCTPDLHGGIEPRSVLERAGLDELNIWHCIELETIGEPQLPQNFRRTGRPLSPTSSKVFSVWPAILRVPLGTATTIENGELVCF
jgi:hypothetical protein